MVEDVSDLLDPVVGNFDANMRLICREGCADSFLLTLREPITRRARKIADRIEGIACAAAVAQCVLLDATAHLIESVTGELDDVKGIEHAGGVLELVINGVLMSREGIEYRDSHPARKSSPRSVSQFLYAVPNPFDTRSSNRAVR